jgi:hypothetical protein
MSSSLAAYASSSSSSSSSSPALAAYAASVPSHVAEAAYANETQVVSAELMEMARVAQLAEQVEFEHDHVTLFGRPVQRALNLESWSIFTQHRSGWDYAMRSLLPLHNLASGIKVIDVMEKTFSWSPIEEPLAVPWIGWLHNANGMPHWFDVESSPQRLLERAVTVQSLQHCKGIFVCSKFLREWLVQQPVIRDLGPERCPVSVVHHPTEDPAPENHFSWDAFVANAHKSLLQVGYWQRRLSSIGQLRLGSKSPFAKKWLYGNPRALQCLEKAFLQIHDPVKQRQARDGMRGVEYLDHVSNQQYDALLRQNIVYLDLYTSSCNNAIIECIMRATPVLVNPHPAVREYLGDDYPLYFHSREEAVTKLHDMDLLHKAHVYLRDNHQVRARVTGKRFLRDVASSDVYANITRTMEEGQIDG